MHDTVTKQNMHPAPDLHSTTNSNSTKNETTQNELKSEALSWQGISNDHSLAEWQWFDGLKKRNQKG